MTIAVPILLFILLACFIWLFWKAPDNLFVPDEELEDNTEDE